MTEDIIKKLRPGVSSIGDYIPGKAADNKGAGARPGGIIKLNANENPYGCSPRVNRALASYPAFNIYPDAGQEELRGLLGGYCGVPAECIVAAGGSNQLIDDVLRLFVGPGDEVIDCVPTFDLYRFRVQVCGGTPVKVPRKADFAVDVAAVQAAVTPRTKAIVIATPNNPTGTVTPPDMIRELAETGLPLVVDEAYIEFGGQTVAPLVARYENLMVLRTFSKWAGLAGLRVGYGVFAPKFAALLMRTKLPFSPSSAAVIAVRESLADLALLKERVALLIAERERLFVGLKGIKWLKVFPSQANFIFCTVVTGNARAVQAALEEKGILVRYFDVPLLENAIRISVGKPEHTDALKKALKDIS